MKKEKWTLQNLEDQTGKTVLVTGASSGLGYETSLAFAAKNAFVTMACRNLEKGEAAKSRILALYPTANISLIKMDLMDLSSIEKFANQFMAENTKLDILINNAGIMMHPYQLTKDGFESQMGTNHLGHFALTGRLMGLIKSTPGARVVNVASLAHKQGKIDFSNLLYENGEGYDRVKAYGRSKLSNLLFTYELQRFFENHGINAISVAAHPGASMTNLFSHMVNKFFIALLKPIISIIVQPSYMGALPQIRAAADPTVKGGQYFGPDGFYEMRGYPHLVESTVASHNREDAKKLWVESERLTGVVFS